MTFPFRLAISKHRLQVVLALIVLTIVAVFLIAVADYYPILIVNNRPVSARTFWQDYRSAVIYYDNAVKTYDPSAPRPKDNDLRAEVLTQLVEAELIDEAVSRDIGREIDELVRNKLRKYEENEKLQKAAPALYGLEFKDFWEHVLVPHAKRDVLAGRLFLEGKNIEEWLRDAKAQAAVTLFSKQFRWTGERVEFVP